MVARKRAGKHIKAGTSKSAAAARKVVFAKAYIANNMNAEKAAIACGLSPKTARSSGQRMLTDVVVKGLIAEFAGKVSEIAGLNAERTALEIARIAYSDPRQFYDAYGNLISIRGLSDDAVACVSSIEIEEIKEGTKVIGLTKKIKLWDKNSALEKAAKIHGLYKQDNMQRGDAAIRALMEAVSERDDGFEVRQ